MPTVVRQERCIGHDVWSMDDHFKPPLPTTFSSATHGSVMARVTVVGAGIAGLTAALYAVTAGHHVVVLDRTDRLGGRATSQTVDGAPFGYGLHLLLQRGPLMKVVKKISRMPVVLASPRMDRLHVVGVGPLRPRNNVRLAAELRRALKRADPNDAAAAGAALLADSGVPRFDGRYAALQKGRLTFVGEGWAGLVGRMAAALDEVGVLIEPNCHVKAIQAGKVSLEDGRTFQSDIIVLACGFTQAKRLLQDLDIDALDGVNPVRASTVDATLSARPLGDAHGVVDPEAGGYVLDVANVQPKLGLDGAFLSALMVERAGESKDERLKRLERFLARHAKGWDRHVLHERRQRDIVVQTTGQKPAFDAHADRGILLAGEWVLSEHALADAAAATGKLCGQNIR